MRIAVLAFFVAVLASGSHAKTVTYEYTGQEMYHHDPFGCGIEQCYRGDERRTLSGKISFNLDFVPGNTLANSVIEFALSDVYSDELTTIWTMTYKFKNLSNSVIIDWTRPSIDWTPAPVLAGYSDMFYDSFAPMFINGGVNLKFDSKSRIVDWFNYGTTGGSGDWQSGLGGDSDWDLSSDGPGKWQNIAEVPLPSTFSLFGAALVCLAALLRAKAIRPTWPVRVLT